MVYRYLDPVHDAEAYYEAQDIAREMRRERLPYCDECGKKIDGETFYIIGDEFICENCMDKHMVWTDDWLENI